MYLKFAIICILLRYVLLYLPFKISVMYLCKFCMFKNGQFMFLKYIFVHIKREITPPPLRVSIEYSVVDYIY